MFLYVNLVCFQINSQEGCNGLFSNKSFEDKGVPEIKRMFRIPNGFTNDIVCAENDFQDNEVIFRYFETSICDIFVFIFISCKYYRGYMAGYFQKVTFNT